MEKESLENIININQFADDLYKLKEKLIQGMSQEDTDETNNYYDEIMSGIQPVAEKINNMVEDEQSRKVLGHAIKNAIKDNEWLEKLSKTSYSSITNLLQETE
jgi:hypothetical protein